MGKSGHVWCKRIRRGKMVSKRTKRVQRGFERTKLVQVELELVEGSKITSKCVKIKMKADKLEYTKGITIC